MSAKDLAGKVVEWITKLVYFVMLWGFVKACARHF